MRDCGYELVDHSSYFPDLAPYIFFSPANITVGFRIFKVTGGAKDDVHASHMGGGGGGGGGALPLLTVVEPCRWTGCDFPVINIDTGSA